MRTRSWLLSLVIVLAGACGEGQPPETSPEPTQDIPTVDDLTRAIDALDRLDSYRLTLTDPQTDRTGDGMVVNGPPVRFQLAWSVDGEVIDETISIGQDVWLNAGDSWIPIGGEDPEWRWSNPAHGLLDHALPHVGSVADLGREVLDGVPTRHLLGLAADVLTEEDLESGVAFEGKVDAWIASEGGHLVAAHVQGRQIVAPVGEGQPAQRHALDTRITIHGVNDPGNEVLEPSEVREPPGAASPDPQIVALLDAADAGLRNLDSYVVTVDSSFGKTTATSTLTVVNRPTQAALIEFGGDGGLSGLAILLIGDERWARFGSEAWQPTTLAEYPTCSLGGIVADATQPCTIAELTAVAGHLRALAATFEAIPGDDVVAGVGATHLRSTEPRVAGSAARPGTTDVWFATRGGYLVREVFDSPGIGTTLQISRVNDPTLTLERPD